MKFIGFYFNKINAEKLLEVSGEFKINTNVTILNVEKIEQNLLKSKEQFVNIDFLFTVEYEPRLAKIEFKGKVLFAVDQGELKEILKEWGSKKICSEMRMPLFNIILQKTNIRALQIEEEMNLPPHINLPSVKIKENSKGDSD